jgi:hypothetical protein
MVGKLIGDVIECVRGETDSAKFHCIAGVTVEYFFGRNFLLMQVSKDPPAKEHFLCLS